MKFVIPSHKKFRAPEIPCEEVRYTREILLEAKYLDEAQKDKGHEPLSESFRDESSSFASIELVTEPLILMSEESFESIRL